MPSTITSTLSCSTVLLDTSPRSAITQWEPVTCRARRATGVTDFHRSRSYILYVRSMLNAIYPAAWALWMIHHSHAPCHIHQLLQISLSKTTRFAKGVVGCLVYPKMLRFFVFKSETHFLGLSDKRTHRPWLLVGYLSPKSRWSCSLSFLWLLDKEIFFQLSQRQ